MGRKGHLPLSAKRKKRRIGPGLEKYIEDRRMIAASNKENSMNEEGQSSAADNPRASSAAIDGLSHPTHLCGRRIVKIADLLEQLKNIGNHGPLGCTFSNMAYGRKYEETARQQASAELGKTIQPCGLFIDADQPFLGASPDGLIDDDGLIEIKCPSSAKSMTPDEAIEAKKVTCWTLDKRGKIGPFNNNHIFYFQIQGQLHIAKRQYCQFVLWTPKGLKLERIVRDDEFWVKNMSEKLEMFYLNCILPELIDPHHNRSMPIRNPTYITEARKKLEERKGTRERLKISTTMR